MTVQICHYAVNGRCYEPIAKSTPFTPAHCTPISVWLPNPVVAYQLYNYAVNDFNDKPITSCMQQHKQVIIPTMTSWFNCTVKSRLGFFCSCCKHVLTCEEEEHEDHDHGVTKVEDGAGHSDDLQLWEEVMHSVDEQVDCCEAAGQEGTPPPVVVLGNTVKQGVLLSAQD